MKYRIVENLKGNFTAEYLRDGYNIWERLECAASYIEAHHFIKKFIEFGNKNIKIHEIGE